MKKCLAGVGFVIALGLMISFIGGTSVLAYDPGPIAPGPSSGLGK